MTIPTIAAIAVLLWLGRTPYRWPGLGLWTVLVALVTVVVW
jgi:hypothetical protein